MKNWICSKEFKDVLPIKISKENKAVTDPHENLHTLFRKTFNLAQTNSTYTLDITADDYYKLYINGTFIGQGPAQSYFDVYNYNKYDITKYLREGKNVIAVHCYYQGLVNRAFNSGDLRQGLYAKLYTDDEILLYTDETWRYKHETAFKSDCKLGYDTQFSENIDMREYTIGWTQFEFDDEAWENARIKENDDHELIEQITPTVCVYELEPKCVTYSEDGFILDFGREITAGIKLRAGEDAEVRIKCGEELDKTGRVRFNMRCNVSYDETWIITKGNTVENYDYKGFRYVEVKTDNKNIKPSDFTAVVRHYPVKNKAKFTSSDETLNKIWEICENATIISSQEGFLDCPTREKGQYLGDLTVTAVSHTYITGDYRLYKKALTDFANTSNICEGLMAVAPCSFMQEIADYSLLYPLQLLNYYNLTGDLELLKQLLPVAEGVISYFRNYERKDGLLENVTGKWNLVDWPQNLRDGYDFDLSQPVGLGCHNIINAYYYGAMKNVNEIRNILGFEDKYEIAAFKNTFHKVFFSEESRLYKDSEVSSHSALHSNALPLYYGLSYEQANDFIVKFIKEKGLCCGVFFSYFVLKALASVGEHNTVYDFITADNEHSWAQMIKEGATACFEAWGKEQKWNTSLCHPWASAPIILIIEDIAGIKLQGGKLKAITPKIPLKLKNFEVSFFIGDNEIKFEL